MKIATQVDVIPRRLLLAASADWPGPEWSGWHRYENGKLASRSLHDAPESVKRALYAFADAVPLWTPNAFADFSFSAAGIHELPPGVGLGWHRDAERHQLHPWRRVETALLYLDEGGALMFDGDHPAEIIDPTPGLSVVFLPEDERTQHCVVAPDKRRRSLAVFFYVLDPEFEGSIRAEFAK